MNKWALSLYIHYKNKGVMVAHLVSYSHRFKEFYGDHCANMHLWVLQCHPCFTV